VTSEPSVIHWCRWHECPQIQGRMGGLVQPEVLTSWGASLILLGIFSVLVLGFWWSWHKWGKG